MAREAGADHVAELRGVLALPYLSRWPRHGEPWGGRDRADEDERTQPLLLQLSQARHWPHADRWPDRGRQDGHRQFPDGAGRENGRASDFRRQGPRCADFRAGLGGTYLTLENGKPTGFAPLKALENKPEDRAWLSLWVRQLVRAESRPITVQEERMIDEGIAAVMRLPREDRSL